MAKSLEEALIELRRMTVPQLPPNCAAGCDFENWLRDGAGYSEEEIDAEELDEWDIVAEEVCPELTRFIFVTDNISSLETVIIQESPIFAYAQFKNDDFKLPQKIQQFNIEMADNEEYTGLESAA